MTSSFTLRSKPFQRRPKKPAFLPVVKSSPDLVMSPVTLPSNSRIDVEALNTFDIVWLARQALEADDLEQAVKYMNLLRGEPRRQASDWLSSARTHLEIHQVSEALAAYATAVGAE